MTRPLIVVATAAVALALAGVASAATREPWEAAADVRTTLAEAQRALVLGEPARAERLAREAAANELAAARPGRSARPRRRRRGRGRRGLGGARDRARHRLDSDPRGGARAGDSGGGRRRRRGGAERGSSSGSSASRPASHGRAPTRRSHCRRSPKAGWPRPGRGGGARGLARHVPGSAARLARHGLRRAWAGFDISRSGAAALARGYFALLAAAYAEQRSAGEAAGATAAFEDLVAAAQAGDDAGVENAQSTIEAVLGASGPRRCPRRTSSAAPDSSSASSPWSRSSTDAASRTGRSRSTSRSRRR